MEDVQAIDCTAQDLDLFARLLSAECRGEPLDGQLAVATVVVNRLKDNAYPDTLAGVILQKYQFARPAQKADERCIAVAKKVLEGYRTFGECVLLFQRRKQAVWYGHKWLVQIGAHNFYSKSK